MKLLAGLRVLKLSLMGNLSMLSALKPDHMINALGVGSASLLDAAKDNQLSREKAEELEETRRKLAGISANLSSETSLSAPISGKALTHSTTMDSLESLRKMDTIETKAQQPDTSPSTESSLTSAGQGHA